MAADDREDDLAVMFARVTRRLGDAEEPLLADHDLSMWEYIVLSRLARGPATNQLTLARDIRHDKTRLIRLLDRLQPRGLISRDPDPADRRSHTVTITGAGRTLHAAARADIREMENQVLGDLAPGEREALLAALPKLYTVD